MRRYVVAHISASNSNACAATSPAPPLPTSDSPVTAPAKSAATEESLQRRHHPYRHGAAGVHGTPDGSGAAPGSPSDGRLPPRLRLRLERNRMTRVEDYESFALAENRSSLVETNILPRIELNDASVSSCRMKS